jgi:hypothetical protein
MPLYQLSLGAEDVDLSLGLVTQETLLDFDLSVDVDVDSFLPRTVEKLLSSVALHEAIEAAALPDIQVRQIFSELPRDVQVRPDALNRAVAHALRSASIDSTDAGNVGVASTLLGNGDVVDLYLEITVNLKFSDQSMNDVSRTLKTRIRINCSSAN